VADPAPVALVTEPRYAANIADPGDWYQANILADDGLLSAALAERGVQAERVAWSLPEVDWSRYRALVFRTIWDYFERFHEFQPWLERVGARTRLINEFSTVRWNMDKHYLGDLARKGIPVVPCRFVERGEPARLAERLSEFGGRGIVKPCVSGTARHTYRLNPGNFAEVEPIVHRLLESEAMIVQPFIESVTTEGEDSLVVIGGRYTHAVRKIPKAGDFRVQDDFGGTVHPRTPTAEQIELAERAVAACEPAPAYGRVDLVRDAEGRLAIMELELIEPELWLRRHPPAATALAEAIVARLG
jgi:glutathione synthase/RimK-type ligase-like ATP-grasp enzyme